MKIILAILIIFGLIGSAGAQTGSAKTPAALNTETNALWPDENAGAITPYNARQTLLDIIASGVPSTNGSVNQIPVFPGSGGAPIPTTVGGTGGFFDTICSSTIGQFWVRLSSGWGCTSLGYANPVWWGADPTGSSDSAAALNSAIAASKYVQFPPGSFKLNSNISVTIANNASFHLGGAGSNVTVLNWPNASGGLTLSLGNEGSNFSITNLSLTTPQTGSGTAIAASGVSNSSVNTSSLIEGVDIRGSDGPDGTDYWATGISLTAVPNVNIIADDLVGAAVFTGNGSTGISLASTSSTSFTFSTNIVETNVFSWGTSVLYGSYVQGISINSSSLLGANYNIRTPASPSGPLSGLQVHNTQFNCVTDCIYAESTTVPIGQAAIIGNVFETTGTPNMINLRSAQETVIADNIFLCASGGIGIDIANSYIASIPGVIVADNTLRACNGTGAIYLESTAEFVDVHDNSIGPNSTPLSNAATVGITITNNIGYNPVGATAAASVCTSPCTITAGASPETHYLNQSATNTATVTVGGKQVATLVGTTSYWPIQLGPNESMVVTWTTTDPTDTKYVH